MKFGSVTLPANLHPVVHEVHRHLHSGGFPAIAALSFCAGLQRGFSASVLCGTSP
jgi:hypothetical protein